MQGRALRVYRRTADVVQRKKDRAENVRPSDNTKPEGQALFTSGADQDWGVTARSAPVPRGGKASCSPNNRTVARLTSSPTQGLPQQYGRRSTRLVCAETTGLKARRACNLLPGIQPKRKSAWTSTGCLSLRNGGSRIVAGRECPRGLWLSHKPKAVLAPYNRASARSRPTSCNAVSRQSTPSLD
jgi:hypothetical protein